MSYQNRKPLTDRQGSAERFAMLPLSWLSEQADEISMENAGPGDAVYRQLQITGLWIYQLYTYLDMVRRYMGEQLAGAVWTRQLAILDEQGKGAADAVRLGFSLVECALESGAGRDDDQGAHDTQALPELAVALALLIGLRGSVAEQGDGDGRQGEIPRDLDWRFSLQLRSGRQSIENEFAHLLRMAGDSRSRTG